MLFLSSSLLLPLSRVDIHLDLILKHIFQSIFNDDVILATFDASFLNCCDSSYDSNLDLISIGPITSTPTDTHLP